MWFLFGLSVLFWPRQLLPEDSHVALFGYDRLYHNILPEKELGRSLQASYSKQNYVGAFGEALFCRNS